MQRSGVRSPSAPQERRFRKTEPPFFVLYRNGMPTPRVLALRAARAAPPKRELRSHGRGEPGPVPDRETGTGIGRPGQGPGSGDRDRIGRAGRIRNLGGLLLLVV